MKLDTAEKRAAYRAVMIPKESTLDPRSTEAGEIYTYTRADALYALGFRGTAGRSEWHHRFRTAEQREQHAAQFFASIEAHKERKAKTSAEVKAFRHDCKVGDIFRASWGYDQTNIDYYQIVELIGQHFAEVREIGQQSEDTAWLQGKCVPAPGLWATEADYSPAGEAYKAEHGRYPRKAKASRRFKIQSAGNDEPCIRIASYCRAYRIKPLTVIEGKPIFAESHWTAYA